MYSTVLKNVMFPLYQILKPPNERYSTYFKFLEKSQWWDYSELKKYQLKQLKKILNHANKNVPYYHKLFKKIGFRPNEIKELNDLEKIPILTKEEILNNLNELTNQSCQKSNLIPTTTGGSTAAPMKFFIDNRWEACNMSAAYRSWGWAGYNLGDKLAYLWGATQDLNDYSQKEKIKNYLLRTIKLNAFNISEDIFDSYVKKLEEFKPKIINSYASTMDLFARHLLEKNINTIQPKAILTTGDMLYGRYRKTIQHAFNCDVFDYYSGRDTSLQAAECAEHSGYHLSIENAVVEFIEDNEHVSPGETGKIIITDLCNYAVPFIRYEIGDLGVPSDEICSCGRNLPLMKSLKGRMFDNIVTSDGNLLSGIFFHFLIVYYNIQGIKQFQIVQEKINKIIVYIVKNDRGNGDDVNRFIQYIQEKVGDATTVEIVYVSDIKTTKSGKRLHVISKIGQTNEKK